MRGGSKTLSILYTLLRKLAKSNKYQLLYSQYKESGVMIFKNRYNLTDFQVAFLQYLSFYASLNMSIYMDEVPEVVLEDEIYEDAYSYYKRKHKKKIKKVEDVNKPKPKSNKSTVSNTHVVFSRPKIKL